VPVANGRGVEVKVAVGAVLVGSETNAVGYGVSVAGTAVGRTVGVSLGMSVGTMAIGAVVGDACGGSVGTVGVE
jgi:hypothetical protein